MPPRLILDGRMVARSTRASQSPDRVFRGSPSQASLVACLKAFVWRSSTTTRSSLKGFGRSCGPTAPRICVVEFEVEGSPERTIDVTLFDTYGEEQAMRQRVQETPRAIRRSVDFHPSDKAVGAW